MVLKRDGRPAPFDAGKIRSAVARAGAAGEFGEEVAARLAAQVVKLLTRDLPSIEHIQDLVERALIAGGYVATARAYIVYRESHKRLREDRRAMVDVAASMNEYLERQDWRVNANANQGYSLGGLILNVAG